MIVGLKYRICEFQWMCLEDEGDCARVESVVNGCRSEVSNLRMQQM